ncbi:MAG: cupin domain-containing protein [Chloroflexi bacterium]|nr:MAG: cupin domain-containing protein [Chloroflexota bacterium]
MAERQQAFVLQPGEGRSIDMGNFSMSVKASGDDTSGAFTLLEAAEPPDFGPPLHIHRNAAEAFYVLEGDYLIFIEERQHRCPAGSFIYIPSGIVHGFRVGSSASRKLNLYAPAAMIGYFDALAASQNAPLGEDELTRIALDHGVEIVGPVPEGYR